MFGRCIGIIFILSCVSLSALQADFAINKLYDFEIDEYEDGAYELQCWTTLVYTYQTTRSLDKRTFYFYEAGDNPITQQSAGFGLTDLTDEIKWSSVHSSDVFYSDNKRNWVTIPSRLKPKIGDTLKILYKTEYSHIANLPIVPLHGDLDVNRIWIKVTAPIGCEVDFTYFSNRSNFDPIIEKGISFSSLRIENVEAIEEEEYDPFPGILGYALITVTKDGRSLTPNTPETFSQWYLGRLPRCSATRDELLYEAPTIPDSLIDTIVPDPNAQKELLNSFSRNRIGELFARVDSLETDEERINLMQDFISRNVRYVAEHQNGFSFIPHSPVHTLNNMYGDCKDKSMLLRYLASLYGIEVDLALVSIRPSPPFDVVHSYLYDHMICHWSDNGTSRFLDPTRVGSSTYRMSEALAGKEALIISGTAPIKKVIEVDLTEPVYDIHITAQADSLDRARAEIILRGSMMLDILRVSEHYTDLEIENVLTNFLSEQFINVPLDYFTLRQVDSTRIVFDSKAKLTRLIPVSSKRLYMPKTPFSIDSQAILKREGDTPIYTSTPLHGRLTIDIEAPGYLACADSLEIVDTMWDFKARCNSDQGKIHAEYEILMMSGLIQGEDNLKLVQCIREYDKNRKSMFAIDKEKK